MNVKVGLGILIVASWAGAQDAAQDEAWTNRTGMQLKMSTLGAGIEGAVKVAPRINVRAGFNDFSYGRSFDNNGIHYDGNLTLRSASVNADFYVLGPLHLSPGLLLYDGNRGSATASVPGGQTFTLGSATYLSNPSNPANGSATLGFNAAAPEFLIGFGNLVPRSRRRFTVNFEFGAAYQGSPAVKLNLGGGVCNPSGASCVNAATDPAVQSNVEAQQAKLSRNLSFFRFYPLVSLGFGFRF
jgi:hypothetical protein